MLRREKRISTVGIHVHTKSLKIGVRLNGNGHKTNNEEGGNPSIKKTGKSHRLRKLEIIIWVTFLFGISMKNLSSIFQVRKELSRKQLAVFFFLPNGKLSPIFLLILYCQNNIRKQVFDMIPLLHSSEICLNKKRANGRRICILIQ